MRAFRAIFLRECVELAPATLVAVALGVWEGIDSAMAPGLTISPLALPILFLGALAVGLWHGVIDRRQASASFSRHRPVARTSFEGARWAAGCATLTWMFAALVAARSVAVHFVDAELLADFRRQFANGRMERWSTGLFVWGYAGTLLIWSVLRVAVSWRGVAAPVILSLLLPAAIGTAIFNAPPGYEVNLVVFVVFFSLYQGARLSKVTQ